MEHALRKTNAAVQLNSKLSAHGMEEEFNAPKEAEALPQARRATPEEEARNQENLAFAREAQSFCQDCINHRGLDMKLVDVEILFDRSKMIFFFTAPTRIDFRELVKDLVRQYHTRIELRQIGVRHEAQMLGAVGNCGMVCCCRRYLHSFAPVTVKMAKEQNLFLNPTKISGICGRLLCCLSYEQENYDAFHRSCPRLGKTYQTSEGALRVFRSNLFRNSITVHTDDGQEKELTLEEWQALRPSRGESSNPQSEREAKPKPAPLMFISTTPETLEDDLASLDGLEEEATFAAHSHDHENSQAPESSGRPNIKTSSGVKP